MRHSSCAAVATLLWVAAASVATQGQTAAQPRDVALDQVPAVVKDAAAALAPGLTLTQASLATDSEGEPTYTLHGTANGRNVVLAVKADATGRVRMARATFESDEGQPTRSVFDKAKLEDVPAVVTQAAQSAAPGFQPQRAFRGQYGGRDGYRLEGLVGADKVKVKLLATGEPVEIEKRFSE